MELRFVSGLLVGFFLATALMFGMVQMYIAPSYNDLLLVKPYIEEANAITQSEKYASTQAFVAKLGETADKIADMPIIGAVVDKTKVPEYISTVSELLMKAKENTYRALVAVNTCITLIQWVLPGLIVSIIMIAFGYVMLSYTYMSKAKQVAFKKGKFF